MDPSALDRKKKTDFLVEFPDLFAIGSHVYLGLTGCTDTLPPNNLLDVWIASWLHGWDGMGWNTLWGLMSPPFKGLFTTFLPAGNLAAYGSSGLFQRTNI